MQQDFESGLEGDLKNIVIKNNVHIIYHLYVMLVDYKIRACISKYDSAL